MEGSIVGPVLAGAGVGDAEEGDVDTVDVAGAGEVVEAVEVVGVEVVVEAAEVELLGTVISSLMDELGSMLSFSQRNYLHPTLLRRKVFLSFDPSFLQHGQLRHVLLSKIRFGARTVQNELRKYIRN